jgi:anaerobic magnesium-protoporphyrin IX monomethyl ester cyclase
MSKLVLSHGYFLEEDAKEKKIMRPYPPLGILYISAFLEQHGYPNDVFDTTFSSKEKFYKYLLEEQPKVIGLYSNLMTKINIVEIVRFTKANCNSVVIIGGPDVTYNSSSYLQSGADYLVLGEGEQTMLQLVGYVLSLTGNRNSIPGIAFLESGQVIETAEREKLKDLDVLPVPNRSKINFEPYLSVWRKYHGKNAMSVSTMRGCPYTCKWCSRGVYGLSYRRRSPEKVVEELKLLQQHYNPDSLWFVDDVFTISHKWLEGFKEQLQKEDIRISYECITRADRMNEHVVRLLKDTGCFRVWIGAESGSQKVIDLMDRRVDVEQVRDMIKLSKEYGIETGTFIMLGYPGETEEDIEETIKHLKVSSPDHFTITVAYPIKGTELYNEVAPTITTTVDWQLTTDRETDFRRTYSPGYYQHAVRRVINEVNYFKSSNKWNVASGKMKLISIVAKIGMKWQKLKTSSRHFEQVR